MNTTSLNETALAAARMFLDGFVSDTDPPCLSVPENFDHNAFASMWDETSTAINAALKTEMEAKVRAACDVLAERERQKAVEGWTPEHDDGHSDGELAAAAICYAFTSVRLQHHVNNQIWPWSSDWFKPTTRRRDLVKAGALILAEIERLDRAAAAAGAPEAAA